MQKIEKYKNQQNSWIGWDVEMGILNLKPM